MKKINKTVLLHWRRAARTVAQTYSRRGIIFRKFLRFSKKFGKKSILPKWREIAAVFVLMSLVLGSFWGGSVDAATYLFTQTDWSGGADTVSVPTHASNRLGWNKYNSLSDVTVSEDGGSLQLALASTTFTETFDTTTYKDTENTTGTWNTAAGAMQMTDSVGNPISAITTALGSVALDFDIDTANNLAYIISTNSQPVKFWKYNLTTGELTNLSSRLSSAAQISKIIFDPGSGSVFVGGTQVWDDGYDGGHVITLFKYSPSTDQTSVVYSGNVYTEQSPVASMGLNAVNGLIYFGSASGLFRKYSVQANSVTDLSSKISSFWGGGQVSSIEVDESGQVYLGSSAGKLAKYVPSTNTATDLTSAISSFWGTASINTIEYEPISGALYWGGGSGKLAKYVPSTNTATDLTSTISSFWSTAAVTNLVVGLNNDIYIGGLKLAKYVPSTNTATDLTSAISSFWSTAQVTLMIYNSSNENLYLTGTLGKFANLPPGCSTCVAQSLSIDSTSSTITSATLSKEDTPGSGSILYYLSNDGGATYEAVIPGENHSFSSPGSDLRFKVALSGNASVQSLSVKYYYYNPSGYLISSVYDSGDPTNIMGGVSWDEDASLPTGTGVTVSVRSGGTADLSASAWTALSSSTNGCTKNNTTGAVTCSSSVFPEGMRDGSNDQYFQYKVLLETTGGNTPTVSEARVTYVVNVSPEFNSAYPAEGGSGVSVTQVSDENDADFGKVKIQYSVRDQDTSLGSNTPGYITPSFEFNIGGGWVAVQEAYLRVGDLDNKAMDSNVFTTYSAVWDAASQIPGQSVASAQIRVTINDNEAANNTTQATSASFVLDTAVPSVSVLKYDMSLNKVVVEAADTSNLQYRFSSSEDFSASSWTSVQATSINSSLDWSGAGNAVYAQIRDISGNVYSGSAIAPEEPINLDLRDVGNAQSGEYREFLSWRVYAPASGVEFAGYEVYRSTDGTSYTKITTVTDINQNYYTDTAVSTSNTYYYKLATLDSGGDRSSFSTIVSDTPDGQGGTDFTAPVISSVTVAETQTGWVRITWTTDEISDSTVQYSTAATADYGLSESNTALVTNHSIVLDGLTPGTAYVFRVKSSDILNNEGMDDNSGSGHAFTTGSGTAISGVAVRSANDTSANIVWYTSGPADSRVVYSTDLENLAAGTNTLEAGSANFVAEPYEHSVNLTNLTPRTTYYFYVKSTAQESQVESIDNKGGDYYEFNTTLDQKDPDISDVQTPILAPTAASITWVTDELADSVVDYGLAADEYTMSSSLDPTMSIYHVVTLNGLNPETKYYFRVKSSDAVGNRGVATSTLTTISDLRTVYIQASAGSSSATEDTSAPTISDIEVKNISAFGAEVHFRTNEDTIPYVNFGEKENYGKTVGTSKYASSHQVDLFGLRSGVGYNFEVKVYDKAGNMGASPNQSFKTKFASEELDELTKLENMQLFQDKIESIIESTLPSLVPPVISDVEVVGVTENSAEIAWSTNVKTFGSVALVKGEKFDASKADPYEFEMSDTAEKTRTHRMTVPSLEPGTRYNFQVRSFSIPGVIGKSRDYSFATLASNVKGGAITATNNSITLTWQTAEETTSFVEYKNLKTGESGRFGKEEFTRNHIVTVNNLPGATAFEAKFFGNTRDGIRIEGSPLRVTTIEDKSAPSISNVSVSSAFVPYKPNQLQTIVTWRTDEPATSIVQYEEGPGAVDKLSGESGDKDEYVKEHIVILPGFKPGTIYRMRIVSKDMAGNEGVVPTRTTITPTASDSVFEIIVKNFEDVFGFLKNMR